MAYPSSGRLFALLIVLEALFSTGHSTSQFISSRAVYSGTPDGLGTSSGACGYGSYGRDVMAGNAAAASQLLYRNGAGCGACYQVRCKNQALCTANGVTVVVTDHGEGDRTDFIMSPHAFTTMAWPGKDKQLKALGVVDIDYKRVPCNYPGHNIVFKINQSSNYPYYLSLVLLYQGGQRDVEAVEISQERTSDWKEMRRSYGGVWDIVMSPPYTNLAIRFQLSGGEWIYARNPIPSHWKAGALYDAGVQLKY
ncbi:hypothetical protein SUGI_0041700 [Cryptomeria japonica]|uniref:expansin-like B1 n=1 Tax=Cryptomeria japonica TaxID=3369 RepID=UPI002408D97E|nr:expansin-like B1 [Cryptomeria japonica]GLJ06551.1 hypothetical protein SUGI_0041700 [Cryptomeria japonica]